MNPLRLVDLLATLLADGADAHQLSRVGIDIRHEVSTESKRPTGDESARSTDSTEAGASPPGSRMDAMPCPRRWSTSSPTPGKSVVTGSPDMLEPGCR